MAMPTAESGGHGLRRLVLLPVEEDQRPGGRAPAESSLEEVWELADPWGPRVVLALATTRRVKELIVLVDVTTAGDAPLDTTRCLIQQLVATLRRTGASAITSTIADPSVRSELLAIGFISLPSETVDHDAVQHGDRLILQL